MSLIQATHLCKEFYIYKHHRGLAGAFRNLFTREFRVVQAVNDVSFSLGLPRMILVAVMVLFGLFPRLMLDLIQTAVIPFINGLPR